MLLLLLVAILDIPVYKSRIQPLHILFSVYSEFKNSQVQLQAGTAHPAGSITRLLSSCLSLLWVSVRGWQAGQGGPKNIF